jgi:3-hydroxyisobutyrate dehydrogenase
MSKHNGPLRVAFIGLGIMGRNMAVHILAAGHTLHVFNRTASKADDLVGRGAVRHPDAGSASSEVDIVITMLGLPREVEEIYLGPGGVVERAPSGSLLIDMTTSSPSLAARIHAAAKARGLQALDAPVSGGEIGARDAKLSIMVGGDKGAFERALPVLELMGSNIIRQGGAGAGQHTKMANQIVIASTMLGVCEGLAYASRSGLDAHEVLRSIGTGAAGSFLLNNLGPKMLNDDFAPGFFIEHFIKDMTIALNEAQAMGLDMKGLSIAIDQYQALADAGFSRLGTQALFKRYAGDSKGKGSKA